MPETKQTQEPLQRWTAKLTAAICHPDEGRITQEAPQRLSAKVTTAVCHPDEGRITQEAPQRLASKCNHKSLSLRGTKQTHYYKRLANLANAVASFLAMTKIV